MTNKRAFTKLAASICILVSSRSVATEYELIDLGTLGGTRSAAWGMNDRLQVVGDSSTEGDQETYAFSWDERNGMVSLGTLEGNFSRAVAINNAEQVVGIFQRYQPAHDILRAFIWESASGMVELDHLDFGDDVNVDCSAKDISDLGYIAGYTWTDQSWGHACLWKGGTLTDLGTLGEPYSTRGSANGANIFGQAVGLSNTDYSTRNRAFLWETGSIVDLGIVTGSTSSALAINNLGQVVGSGNFPPSNYHAFVWDEINGLTDLGPPSALDAAALSINDLGQAVGHYKSISDADFRACVWNDGIAIDLNDYLPANSGWVLTHAKDVNNYGDIVGFGKYGGQTRRAFLLKANPGQPRTCFYRDLFDSEWPVMAADLGFHDVFSNTPGTYIPERWILALVARVLCRPNSLLFAPTIEAYFTNLQTLSTEDQVVRDRFESYKHVLAAVLMIGRYRRDHFVELLGLANSYEVVLGPAKAANNEAFADAGDLDGDGFTNEEEYNIVAFSGGTMVDFAAAAADPAAPGAKALPIHFPALWGVIVSLLVVGVLRMGAVSRLSSRSK